MGMEESDFIRLQLDMPSALLKRIDAIAEQRAKSEKPPSPWKWLMETPEGRYWWSQNSVRTHLTQEEMNAAIREEWARCTGGGQRGRPRLRGGNCRQ